MDMNQKTIEFLELLNVVDICRNPPMENQIYIY